jgi:hypothetical protein
LSRFRVLSGDKKNATKLKTQISSRFCLRSTTTIESDKIQNTKHEIRPVLYFVFCRPLGTTSYCLLKRNFIFQIFLKQSAVLSIIESQIRQNASNGFRYKTVEGIFDGFGIRLLTAVY